MKKLTNEKVAIALGWKKEKCGFCKAKCCCKACSGFQWISPAPDIDICKSVPQYTNFADCIIYAIETKKLYWKVERITEMGEIVYYEAVVANKTTTAKTPAIALCQALVDYLKVKSEARS